MVIAFVCNGEIKNEEWLHSQLTKYETIIAVDGGYAYCIKDDDIESKVTKVYGDFDSLQEKTDAQGRSIEVPESKKGPSIGPVKDCTDLEMALDETFEDGRVQKAAHAVIFGALGGRFDHSLYNLFVLLKRKESLVFETEEETVFAVKPGDERSFTCDERGQLSLISLCGEAKNIVVTDVAGTEHNVDDFSGVWPTITCCGTGTIKIKCEENGLIGVLRKEPRQNFDSQSLNTHSFGVGNSIITSIEVLSYLNDHSGTILDNGNEKVSVLTEGHKITFTDAFKDDEVKGRVLSFFAFLGPVTFEPDTGTGKSLCWDIGGETYDFTSPTISNWAKQSEVRVGVKEGRAICIENVDVWHVHDADRDQEAPGSFSHSKFTGSPASSPAGSVASSPTPRQKAGEEQRGGGHPRVHSLDPNFKVKK